MTEYDEIPLPPGSAVYMTSFVDLNEIYIRKIEDHNDEFENFLDKINSFCLSGISIINLTVYYSYILFVKPGSFGFGEYI